MEAAQSHSASLASGQHTDGGIVRHVNGFEKMMLRIAKTGTMNVLNVTDIKGPLTLALVEAAVSLLQLEHPFLSARVEWEGDGKPVWVRTSRKVEVAQESLDVESLEEALEHIIPNESLVILDDSKLLWRVKWVKLKGDRHLLVFHISHATCDGTSLMSVVTQFIEYVNRILRGGPSVYDELKAKLVPYVPADILPYIEKAPAPDMNFTPPAVTGPILAPSHPLLENDIMSRRMHFLPIEVGVPLSSKVVAAAKAHKVTVHSILAVTAHLATAALVKLFPSKDNFQTTQHSFNISLRPLVEPRIPSNNLCPAFGIGMVSLPFPETSIDDTLTNTDLFWSTVQAFIPQLEEAKKLTFSITKRIAQGGSVDPLTMVFNLSPFGRRPNFNISNRGNFTVPSTPTHPEDYPIQVNGIWFASTEHISGPSFAHNIITINGSICWTLGWYSPFASHHYAKVLADNILKILKQL